MMMKIDSVAHQPDRAGRYTVRFADGTVMRLYRQTVEDFGLYSGLELEQETYQKLTDAAKAMSAKMRAVRIVAATNVSCQDLQQRLVRKGEDPQKAKEAVAWMADLSLVDDKRTAEQIVERCIQKGYGRSRAKQMLYEKRIPKEYWDAVLENYPVQSDAIVAFLRSRLTDGYDEKDLKKAIDALLRRGHSYGEIRKVLEQLSVQSEDFREESEW